MFLCGSHNKLQGRVKPAAVDVSVPQLLLTRLPWGSEVYVPVFKAVCLAHAQEARQKMRT